MTITPETIERNVDGMWSHTAWDALFGDRENITQDELDAWCADNGIIIQAHTLADEEGSELEQRFERGDDYDIKHWTLQPPDDSGVWVLLVVGDSEDGPFQAWARPA